MYNFVPLQICSKINFQSFKDSITIKRDEIKLLNVILNLIKIMIFEHIKIIHISTSFKNSITCAHKSISAQNNVYVYVCVYIYVCVCATIEQYLLLVTNHVIFLRKFIVNWMNWNRVYRI
jgi:hypothetical protein